MLPRAASSALAVALVATLALADEPKRDLKREEQLRKDSVKVQSEHSRDLEPIVRFAAEKGLKARAADLVATIEKITPEWKTLDELKKLAESCQAASPEPADAAKELDKKLRYAQENYANHLMKLARDCGQNQLFTRAYDLIGDVLDAWPDHGEARKIRGYVRGPGNRWVSKNEAKLLNDNVLYKDKKGVVLGWVPKKDVARWDKGERPFAGGWLPEADEIEKIRTNEYRFWSVESEHFEIRTHVSRAEAWKFSQLLEDYYSQFFRTFLSFFDLESGVKLLFDTQPLKKKHLVYYYASRNDYLNHVKAEHGNDKLLLDSAGFYTQGAGQCTRMSHFYQTDNQDEVLSTTYHEVTHQLFAETKEDKSGASSGNNWVPEGIASYIETWGKDPKTKKWVPGMNVKHERLLAAKQHLASNPGWSLARFVAIDHKEFHESARGLNYSLSEALCHFFMHHDNERYKEDFVRFIAAYYGGKAKENSLFSHIQESGEAALETQFKDYMAKLGE
ncbi:DUF1570 domain-containing protein [bacterium]|nr:DUF1570 domain-containing protein [bacterium]